MARGCRCRLAGTAAGDRGAVDVAQLQLLLLSGSRRADGFYRFYSAAVFGPEGQSPMQIRGGGGGRWMVLSTECAEATVLYMYIDTYRHIQTHTEHVHTAYRAQ
jgi:hypothetical protein